MKRNTTATRQRGWGWREIALSTAVNVCAPLQQLGGEVLILKGFIIYNSVPVSVFGIHPAFFYCLFV